MAPIVCADDVQCIDPQKPVCNFILGECVGCVDESNCGQSQVCDEGTCLDVQRCVNSLDCDGGTVCDRDAEICVECLSDSDCAETHACVEQECILRCRSDKDCTGDGELCDTDEGYCVECVKHVDCPDLYYCDYGRCEVDVCLSGHESCNEDGQAYKRCNDSGSGTEVFSCSYRSSCTQNGAEANCDPWICTPFEILCSSDGATLDQCDADGLGVTTVAGCAAAGGVCENMQCTEIICEPNAVYCDGNSLMQCNPSGTSAGVIQLCDASTQYCDGEESACLLHKCVPNEKTCDGAVAQTCGPLGGGFVESTNCEKEDQVCFGGECREKLCELDDKDCRDNQVIGCTDNGASEKILDTCSTSEHCEEAECVPNSCVPGAPACDGNLQGICNAEGTGLAEVTEDCSKTGDACVDAECRGIICETGERICRTGSLYDCVEKGTDYQFVSTCGAGTFCSLDGVAHCQTQLCAPDTPACDGNRATQCNSTGSGYLGGGTVCDSDELCVSGSCLPLIVPAQFS